MANRGLAACMSRHGDGYDNACADSLFPTLKNELVHAEVFVSRDVARMVVVSYIGASTNTSDCVRGLAIERQRLSMARRCPLDQRVRKKPGLLILTLTPFLALSRDAAAGRRGSHAFRIRPRATPMMGGMREASTGIAGASMPWSKEIYLSICEIVSFCSSAGWFRGSRPVSKAPTKGTRFP
jgi:hypothetical protein